MRRLAPALLLVLALAGCGSSDGEEVTPASITTTAAPERDGEFTYGRGECPPHERPAETPRQFEDAPRKCIEDGVDYGAVVTTSKGAFTVDLLEEDAPGTVNNFVALARWGWYDGDDFHRVVRGYVNQAGDPFGTASPGYTIPDELPQRVADYTPGTLAMANRGQPATGGSQWFVCADCSTLPGPGYSLFGRVTEGLEVVEAINALGQPDQKPSEPVTIESVEITEG